MTTELKALKGDEQSQGDSREHELSVADANRLFYQKHAENYDANEFCVVDPNSRALLRAVLASAVTAVNKQSIRALDACGGSGYASSVLLGLGVETTLVDISSEMIRRWQVKARSTGHEPDVREREISAFLSESQTPWDLIVFSSALHHVEDYGEVVELACEALSPGGVLVTAFDPVPGRSVARLVRRFDWIAHGLLHDRSFVIGAARAKLRRARVAGEPAIGRLAERYATEGIDDRLLVDLIRRRGLEVILHKHEFRARLPAIRGVLRLTRAPSTFHLIARRPAAAESEG